MRDDDNVLKMLPISSHSRSLNSHCLYGFDISLHIQTIWLRDGIPCPCEQMWNRNQHHGVGALRESFETSIIQNEWEIAYAFIDSFEDLFSHSFRHSGPAHVSHSYQSFLHTTLSIRRLIFMVFQLGNI